MKLTYIDPRTATTPRDGQCLVDRWWIQMPYKGILLVEYSKRHYAPQCNANKEIAESIRAKIYPDHDIVFVPVVYLGHINK